MYQNLLLFLLLPILAFAEDKGSDVVIVNTNNNEQKQVIKAPALNPSLAKKIRGAREDAEIQTETLILEKVEKERLKNEQSILRKLFPSSSYKKEKAKSSDLKSSSESSLKDSFFKFGEKAYVSLGLGSVQYPKVENINSYHSPSFFISFGGYAKDYFLFDMSVFYSNHRIHNEDSDIRQAVHQPAVAMALKFSPFSGRVKPYLGVSGSYVGRNWYLIDSLGTVVPEETVDVAQKRWYQSFDGGVVLGADVALGNHFGVNFDLRYHSNFYTETRDNAYHLSDVVVLDKRDSIIISTHFRFYF